MMNSSGARQTVFISCLIFVFFLALLPTGPLAMFGDPDTLWHLATGDLIRSTGHIPQHDTWSFTADEKPWQNISWAWDVILSDVYEQTGWHGLVIKNSLTIAATLSLIFATCFIRSQHGIASFIVTLLVVAILPNNIRPYQISYLFTATLVLLLSQIVRNQCSRGWLLAIPILMIAWVNIHGGFLIAFFLLGMLGLDTLLQKNWRFAGWLIATGIASIIACLINPYGTDIATATLRYMSSDTSFVSEYQPLTLSRAFGFADLYIFLFFMLVTLRPANVPKNEKWAAYIWLFLGMTAIRHVSIFSIIAAPMLAVGLRDTMLRKTAEPPALLPFVQNFCALIQKAVCSQGGVSAVALVAASCAVWMFTAQASQLYGTDSLDPAVHIKEEITFLQTHYPHARLINHYDLGASIIFDGRGKIPLFIDGRGATAYPDALVKDYLCFQDGCKKEEDAQIIKRYAIDGVILPNYAIALLERFNNRREWITVFKGPTATIFMHQSN